MALERDPHRRAGAGVRAGTVVFTLSQPYAPFLSTLTQLFIVNRDQVLANKKPGPFGDLGDYGDAYLKDKVAGSGPVHEGIVGPGDHARDEGLSGLLARLEARPGHPRDLPDGQGRGDDADAPPGWTGGHDRPVAAPSDLRRPREDARDRGRQAAERPAVQHRAQHPAGALVRRPRAKGARLRVRLQDGHRADLRGAPLARGPLPNRVYGHSESVQAYRRTSSRPSASWRRPGSAPASSPSTGGSRPGTRSDDRSASSSSRTSRRSESRST